MVDRNLTVEYLDPVLWGRLGPVMEILNPGREVLYVLSEESRYRAVFRGEVFSWEKEEGETANQLGDRFPDADEIRVYTDGDIRAYYQAVQGGAVYSMDIDRYLEYLYEELSGQILIFHRNRKQARLWRLLQYFSRREGVCNIGITHGGSLYFHCMLEFRKGKLIRITSCDRYGEEGTDWEKICRNSEKEFPGEVIHIMMTLEELKRRFG